ncbi:MAG: DUF6051 family protein [Bacteroidota bacterium]|nr:DUF6051 family protein [Bacteroidota bacterium]
MKYSQRYQELSSQFRLGVGTHLIESNIDVRFFPFQSLQGTNQNDNTVLDPVDEKINENLSFVYPVFMPGGTQKADKAILLLHGLNERSWNKYLPWAEYLCSKTGKPVILFPIAFHMNRSPVSWSNPRVLQYNMSVRRQQYGEDRSMSFANVALSERITEKPYRFYSSGRQSIHDLSTLIEEIKNGKHSLFKENTQIDIMAYSIGAFLAEIIMMANPHRLFSDSKLFLFCGGGIFSSMVGQSRSIMDKKAFEMLYHYYLNLFTDSVKTDSAPDEILESFTSMISPERKQSERESFFNQLGNKLKGISLLADKVMPHQGIIEALGQNCAANRFSQMNFSFPYSHENPFPVGGALINSAEVDSCFTNVFSKICDFLG